MWKEKRNPSERHAESCSIDTRNMNSWKRQWLCAKKDKILTIQKRRRKSTSRGMLTSVMRYIAPLMVNAVRSVQVSVPKWRRVDMGLDGGRKNFEAVLHANSSWSTKEPAACYSEYSNACAEHDRCQTHSNRAPPSCPSECSVRKLKPSRRTVNSWAMRQTSN